MGYFAVLVQDEDKTYAKAVKIVRLHVNIWALRGLRALFMWVFVIGFVVVRVG